MSLEEAAELYARAGYPRTIRTLQRFCALRHLEARKIATMTGEKYLVTPQSVARHIAQIDELSRQDAARRDASRQVATTTALEDPAVVVATENGSQDERDRARQAATEAFTEIPMHPQEPRHEAATGGDTLRPAATECVPPITETPAPQQELKKEVTTTHDMPRQAPTESAATGETSRYVAQLEHQLENARDERDFLREQIDRKDRTIEALIERDRETNVLVRGLQEMLTPLLGGGRRRDEPPTYTQ